MRYLFILLAIAGISACKTQNSKQELALKLEKGKEYKQVMSSESDIDQEMGGQKINMKLTMRGAMTYKVINVSDSGYDMEVRYDSLAMIMVLPQGNMNFSSESANENDVFSSILSEMKGKAFNVRMSRSGKITEVKNIEKLYETAFKKYPNISEEQLNQIRSQIMQSYGNDAFKGNIEMVTAIFPEQQVQEKDSWEVKTKLSSAMPADISTTYKLIEHNKEKILISGLSKIMTKDTSTYVESNGLPIKYDMKGSMLSDISLDPRTGWILEAKIRQDLRGTATVRESVQLPDGLHIPMQLKTAVMVSGK